MSEHEQPAGWVCCVQLLVMPWRLPRCAFQVSGVTACLWGMFSVWWMTGSFLTFFMIAVNEPWGWWSGVWKDFVKFVGPCFIAALFVPMLFAFAYSQVHSLSKREYRAVVIGLSPACVLLPYTLWILSVALVELSGDIMASRNVLNDIAELWFIQIAGSCFWLPAIFFGLVIHAVVSVKQANNAARLYYHELSCSCDYDLRGSIAGGSTSCPECGADIPEWMLTDPKPLLTRPARGE